MTAMTREQALVAIEDGSLQSLAAEINKAHDEALASVRTALGHARRAGDLLIEAKRQLGHGAWLPWLRKHCTDVSARTAQKYMQLARELPKLTAKAPRVADLSLREAIHLVSVTGQIASLDSATYEQVLQRVEQGERPNAAIRAVRGQRQQDRIGTPPPELTPAPQTDDRRRRLNRHEEGRRWEVVIGPNAAGMKLGELIETAKARPKVAELLSEAEGAEGKAVALERQAKALRKEAATLRAGAKAGVRQAVIDEHGPVHCFTETLEYKIADVALDEHLKTLTVSEIIDFLLTHRGEPSVQEVSRGYRGDIRFMGWATIHAPMNGGWVGIGSADSLWPDDNTSRAARQEG